MSNPRRLIYADALSNDVDVTRLINALTLHPDRRPSPRPIIPQNHPVTNPTRPVPVPHNLPLPVAPIQAHRQVQSSAPADQKKKKHKHPEHCCPTEQVTPPSTAQRGAREIDAWRRNVRHATQSPVEPAPAPTPHGDESESARSSLPPQATIEEISSVHDDIPCARPIAPPRVPSPIQQRIVEPRPLPENAAGKPPIILPLALL